MSRPAAAHRGVAARCGHPRLAHADALGQFPLRQARFLAQRGQARRHPAGGPGELKTLFSQSFRLISFPCSSIFPAAQERVAYPTGLARCQRGLMLVEQVVGDQDIACISASPVPALVAADEQDRPALLVKGEEHPHFQRLGGRRFEFVRPRLALGVERDLPLAARHSDSASVLNFGQATLRPRCDTVKTTRARR